MYEFTLLFRKGTHMTPVITAYEPQLTITGPAGERFEEILTPGAVEFVADLHDRFARRRFDVLADRQRKRYEIGNGRDPHFRAETAHIRSDADWRVAGAGPGLEDRRVEITGPTDVASAVGALNSGAKVWLADHEDALSPTWQNIIGGQVTLRDAIRGELHGVTADATPTIVFRPRGWHMPEKHITFADRQGRTADASGALTDFGLYVYNNAQALIDSGRGPYFALPKVESAEEAKLWNDIFKFTEAELGLEPGTIRASVLIETLPAAFEMEEILYELRDHASGLIAGRWDYIFSIIKNYRGRGARFVLPDRNDVTMTVPFMRTYTDLLVKTAHKRGAHAIGGMSAAIVDTDSIEKAERVTSKVRADKKREANDGFDGTWVARPELVSIVQSEFDHVLGSKPNQLDNLREDAYITPAQLLDLRIGRPITEDGVRINVAATLNYLESWLRGTGAVPIDSLVADASTAEISRSQLWQWIHQGRHTEDRTLITRQYVEKVLSEVLEATKRFEGDRYDDAAAVFREVALQDDFPEFMTLEAYAKQL